MDTTTVLSINRSVDENTVSFIDSVEKQFDESINYVVNQILENCDYDIVLLAGPSSSGKTTTANKLVEKINSTHRRAFRVSLDDFYFNREDIPDTDDGIKDFENVTALDIDLIHKVFGNLINDRCANLPIFDFTTGSRKTEKHHIELAKNDVIIVEGIHALNPLIVRGLGDNHVYKIYISVSTRVVDAEGRVVMNKRNLRLIRRMVRDYNYRACPVESTLMQWPGVMKGENKYLFPYESNADIKINSFHAYETCLFKNKALTLLNTVGADSEYYTQAHELADRIENFNTISSNFLPENSLLREFTVV